MKKIILLFFASALLHAQVFDLQRSVETGLKNSKTLNIYKARTGKAEAKIKEIGSQFYPQINAGMAFTRLSDIPPFEFQAPFSPVPIKIQDPILDNYILTAGFKLPVFTGFKLTSLKNAALQNAEAAKADFSAEVNKEAIQIIEAFFNFLRAKESSKLLENSLESLNKRLNDVQNNLTAGLIKRSDLLKIEVEVKKLKSSLIEAKNRVKIARTLFNKAIGVNLTSGTDVTWGRDNFFSSDYNLNELLDEAIKNRDELKSFELRENAAKQFIESEKSVYYPELLAFGNYYYNRPNRRILPLEDTFNETWELGVSLNWNVFDWGKTAAKVTQAEADLTEISNRKELVKENIQTEVIGAYNNYISAKSKIEAAKLAVESAKENLKVTANLFEQQMATASELTDAETQLLKAKTGLLFAEIDARLALKKLLKSAGRRVY